MLDESARVICNPTPPLGVPSKGQVAQLVEQWTENPRVGSSILSLATIFSIIFARFIDLKEVTDKPKSVISE